jgi:DNA-binding NtrC family response regulator
VDAAAVLARAHLSGARRARPLALVDATRPAEHDPARWLDPTTSPLALADGGMLALLDGAALPLEVQRIIARASAEGRTPWERPERLDVQLALTGVEVPASLVASGRLDPSLASRLGDALDAPVVLPRLRDRPEDFRALVLDGLVREGLRVFGRPVGIEPAAYARLAEHPFPGDEAELSLLLARLVARSTGEVVRRADVDALLPGIAPPSRRSTRSSRRKDPISA